MQRPEEMTITVSQGDIVELATRLMKNKPAVTTEAKNITLVRMVLERDARISELEAQLVSRPKDGVGENLTGTKEEVRVK